MAEEAAKAEPTGKTATTANKTATTAKKAPAKRKTPAKKATAKKATAKKATAKKTTAKRKPAAKKTVKRSDLRSLAVETGRSAYLAGLGVYGKAYDQLLDQFEAVQKQVDDVQDRLDSRRKQAEDLYEALVKRGEVVEKDALKVIDDLEIEMITDRKKLEEQMNKAKARFEELRKKVAKAV